MLSFLRDPAPLYPLISLKFIRFLKITGKEESSILLAHLTTDELDSLCWAPGLPEFTIFILHREAKGLR
ncbi:unnamed protein product [Lactuca virosa]|uniref:Uncharacterized protein n=1 Tax=Lactuca virosa TaxID=75947 RepID=A0AAU9LLU1_9ASTR|nr:unnamed protein product [Lactuca virosa]